MSSASLGEAFIISSFTLSKKDEITVIQFGVRLKLEIKLLKASTSESVGQT